MKLKQAIAILTALTLLALATACAAQPEPVAVGPEAGEPDDSLSIEADAPPLAVAPEGADAAGERLLVMDALLYRGVVEELGPLEGGGYSLLLRGAEGTGHDPSFSAATDEYTRANFELTELEPGDYIEIYYSGPADGDPVTVIAANKLPDADLCVYNGELALLERDGEGSGSMELRALSGEDRTVFHFDDSTQFYLDLNGLEPGARLNIFHTGALTRSIPPQGFALEVRLYTTAES